MGLNKNNFLRWDGSFQSYPIEIIADDKGPYVLNSAPGDYLEIDLLATVTSTYPIDPKSVEILDVENNYFGAIEYYPNTMKLRVYKPASPVFLTLGSIGYRFKDKVGNQSTIGRVYIESTSIAKAFRGYQPSYRCVTTSAGQNTGMGRYASRIQYYPSTGKDVKPLNILSNTGQIADIADPGNCPVPSQYFGKVTIRNNYPADPLTMPTIRLTGLTFKRTGFADINHALSVNEGATGNVLVPIGIYNDILVNYVVLIGSGSNLRPYSYQRLDTGITTSGTFGVNIPYSIGTNTVPKEGAIINS